jgi:hypothetical protein
MPCHGFDCQCLTRLLDPSYVSTGVYRRSRSRSRSHRFDIDRRKPWMAMARAKMTLSSMIVPVPSVLRNLTHCPVTLRLRSKSIKPQISPTVLDGRNHHPPAFPRFNIHYHHQHSNTQIARYSRLVLRTSLDISESPRNTAPSHQPHAS